MGLLMHWIVLELCMDLLHAHVASWCDSTPTVAWASKLLSTKATTVTQLLWTLALRMLNCHASLLTTLHVAGDTNKMADFSSRSFWEFPMQCRINPNGIPYTFSSTTGSILELVMTAKCNNLAHLCHAVNKDTNTWIVALTCAMREHYWGHWTKFLPCNIDPYLQNMNCGRQFTLLQLFAWWVWEDATWKECQVKLALIFTMPPLSCKPKHTDALTW